jgi:hypothetical protein
MHGISVSLGETISKRAAWRQMGERGLCLCPFPVRRYLFAAALNAL